MELPPNVKDLTGQMFDRWTVLEFAGISTDRRALWKCECSCGTVRNVIGKSLRSEKSKSCGCLQRDVKKEEFKAKYLNKRFEKLVVTEVLDEHGSNGHRYVECLCDCGTYTKVSIENLKSGNTTSCGCFKSEKTSERNRLDVSPLIGKTLNNLTILEGIKKKSGRTLLRCLCNCGKEVILPAVRVLTENTKSCGCRKYSKKEEIDKIKVGDRSERLVVVDLPQGGKIKVKCNCEKETEKEISIYDFLNKKIRSCGCLKKETPHRVLKKDRIGQRFGLLTVLEEDKTKTTKGSRTYYKCKCDCGNTTTVHTSQLAMELTRSCGCLKGNISETLTQREIKEEFKGLQVQFNEYLPILKGLELDIYLPELSLAIEVDGKQHYQYTPYFHRNGPEDFEKQKERDKKKNKLCKESGITLLRYRVDQLDVDDIIVDIEEHMEEFLEWQE
jgi:very-short-patch-repair endonuclease